MSAQGGRRRESQGTTENSRRGDEFRPGWFRRGGVGLLVAAMLATVGAQLISVPSAFAAACTWSATSTTSQWTNTSPNPWTSCGNGSGHSPPTNSDSATVQFSTTNPVISSTLSPTSFGPSALTINSGELDINIGGSITINGNVVIHNDGTHPGLLAISTGGAMTVTGSVTVDSGATLAVTGGTLNIGGVFTNNGTFNPQGGTIAYTGASQAVVAPSSPFQYTNLSLSGSGTKTLPAGALTIGGNFSIAGASTTANGPFTVPGNFTIGTGGTFNASSFSHSVGGNFSNSGTLTAGSSTFTLSGASPTIGGTAATTFNNLTLSGVSATPSLTGNVNVGGALDIGSSTVTTGGSNTLALSTTASTLARTSGYVNGTLSKAIASGGSPSVTYEVGTISPAVYSPVTVNFNSIGTGGSLAVSSTAAQQPQMGTSGLSLQNYVKRYWTMTNTGLVFTSYDATFTFVAGDLQGTPDTNNLLVRKLSSGTWSPPASSSSTATTATATGFTSFSDFAIGNLATSLTSASVSQGTTAASALTPWTVQFTASGTGALNNTSPTNQVFITLPAGSSTTSASPAVTFGGSFAGTCPANTGSRSGQVVTITLPAGCSLANSATGSVTIAGVTNPAASTTASVSTGADSAPVSASVTVTTPVAPTAVTFTPGSTIGGTSTTYTLGFTASSTGALVGSSTITAVFTGYPNLTATPTINNLTGFSGCTATGSSGSTTTLTITLVGSACSLPANTAATLDVVAVTNPVAGSYGAMTLKTLSDSVAATVGSPVIISASSPTAVTFAPTPSTAFATSSFAVGFRTSLAGALSAGSTVSATFDNAFTLPNTPAVTFGGSFTGCGAGATGARTGQTITVTLPSGCTLANNAAGTITIPGITNPSSAGSPYSAANFTVATSVDTIAAPAGTAVTIGTSTPTALSFVGTPQSSGALASWVVGFTPTSGGALTAGSQVVVTFSGSNGGFTVPASPAVTLLSNFTNCSVGSATATGRIATITLADNGGTCAVVPSTATTLRIAGITNPGNGTASGNAVHTTADPTDATLSVTIANATTPANSVSYATTSLAASAISRWTVGFTPSSTGALVAGSTITTTWPTGFTLGTPTITPLTGFVTCSLTATGSTSTTVTITLGDNGGPCSLANATAATFSMTPLTNRSSTSSSTSYAVATSSDTSSRAVSSSISMTSSSAATTPTAGSFVGTSQVANAVSTYTVGFNTPSAGALIGTSTITVQFGAGFIVPVSPSVSLLAPAGTNCTIASAVGNVGNRTVTITLGNSGPLCLLPASTTGVSLSIPGVTNPAAGNVTGNTIATSSSAGNSSTSVTIAITASSVTGVTFSPLSTAASATGLWTVGLTPSVGGGLTTTSGSNTISVTFPAGFVVPASPSAATVSGFTGTCSPTAAGVGQTVTVTLVGSGCALAGGTPGTLTLTGITNPAAAGAVAAAGFTVATARDTAVAQAGSGVTITTALSPLNVTFTGAPNTEFAISTWTAAFDASSTGALAKGSKIFMTFDGNFQLPAAPSVTLTNGFSGCSVGSATTSGQTVTVTLAGATCTLPASATGAALAIAGISNPFTAGPYGPGTFSIATGSDTVAASPASAVTIDPATAPNLVTFSSTPQTEGAVVPWNVGFTPTSTGALLPGEHLFVQFDPAFGVPATPTVTLTSGFSGTCANPVASTTAAEVTITLPSGCSLAASTPATLSIAGITNPANAGSPYPAGDFFVATDTDAGLGFPATDVPIGPATAPLNIAFSGNPQSGGVTSTWSVTLRPSSATSALGAGQRIFVQFNPTFTVPSTPTITLPAGFTNCTATATATGGGLVTITLANGAGTCTQSSAADSTLTIAGITNPGSGNYGGGTFTVHTDFDAANASPSAVVIGNSAVQTVTFAGTPQTAGSSSSWAVGFTPTNVGALAAGDTITATFDNAFSTPPASIQATPAITLGAGFVNCSATAATSGSAVLITLADASGTCAAATGSAKSLSIAGIVNPAAATYVKANFTVVTSKDLGAAHPATDVVIAASSPSPVAFSASPQTAGTVATWTVGLTSSNFGALSAGNNVVVTFPAGFGLPGSPTVTLATGFVGGGSCASPAAITSSQTITVTLPAGCSLPASTGATLTIAGITNPAAGSKPAAGFTVTTTADTTAASPAAPVVIFGGAVTAVSFTAPLLTAGSVVPWTVGFTSTSTGALSTGDTVSVVFPAAFTMPTSPATVALTGSGTAGFAGTCPTTGTVAGHTVTITLTAGCTLAASTPAQLRITGIGNPVAGNQLAAGFTVATSVDNTVSTAPSDILITAATAPTNVTFSGAPHTAGAVATWTVGLQPSSSLDALSTGGKIVVHFDPAFVVASPTITLPAGFTSCTATGVVSGGSTVTITLAGASCAQNPAIVSSLTISGVTNPAQNSYAASGFTVATSLDTATTSPASPVVIDPSAPSNVSFNGSSTVSGVVANWTVGFRTSGVGALVAGNTITATFDPAFTSIPATPTVTLTGFTGTCTSPVAAASSNVVTVTLPAGCSLAANTTASLVINGITNPAPNFYGPSTFTVSTTTDVSNGSPAAAILISPSRTWYWCSTSSTDITLAANWRSTPGVPCDGSGQTPIAGDSIEIQSGTVAATQTATFATVAFPASGSLNNVTIDPGATLNETAGTFSSLTIAIGGSLVNNGTFTAATGALTTVQTTFNGAGNQSISGTGASTFIGLTFSPTNSGAIDSLGQNITMSNAASALSVTAGTLDTGTFTVGSGSGTLAVSAGAKLRVAGAFPALTGTNTLTGSTVEYYGTAQSVLAKTYGNLLITGTGATAAGAINTGGTFTLGSGSSFNAGTFTHAITGNFANNGGTLTPATSTFNFNGNATQTIGGTSPTTFNNISVSANSGVGPTLGNNITLAGSTGTTLALGAKIITTGANTLLLSNATATVTRTGATTANGFVVGNYVKTVGTGAPVALFEIGNVTPTPTYAPVQLTFAGSTGGTLAATTTPSAQPQYGTSGLDPLRKVNRYWTVTPSGGLSFTSYDAQVTFVAADLAPGTATAGLQVRRYDNGGAAWGAAPASSSSTATTATGTGFVTLGSTSSDFVAGDNQTSVTAATLNGLSQGAGATTSWTAGFTTSSTGALNSGAGQNTITVTLAPGSTVSSATPAVTFTGTTGTCPTTGAASGNVVTITLTGTCAIANSTAATVTIAGVTNPGVGPYTGSIATAADSLAVSIPITIDTGLMTAVSVSPLTTAANATGTWTVGFTPSASGALTTAGGHNTITVTYPAGYVVPSGPVGVFFTSGFAGTCSPTASGSGQVVTVTLVGSGCHLNGSTAATLLLAGITNPAATGLTTGFTVATATDTTAVAAPDVTITSASTPTGVLFTGSPQSANALSTWTVAFNSSATGALGTGSKLFATFDPAFGVPASPTVLLTSGFVGCTVASATSAASVVTVTLGGGPACSLPASTSAAFTIAGITNPAATTYAGSLATTSDTVVAAAAPITITGATFPSGVTFAGAPQTAGAKVPWTVGFTTSPSGALPAGSKVFAQFDPTFTGIPASPTVTLTGFTGTCASPVASTAAALVTVTLPAGCSLGNNAAASLTIAGVTNPVAATYPLANFSVRTSTDTQAASPAADVVVAPATSPSGVAFAGNPQAGGVTASWDVTFSPSSGAANLGGGQRIFVAFPSGFTVPATPAVTLGAGFTNCTATATGSGSSATITLVGGTCTESGASTLTIAGIGNPAAGSYTNTNFKVHTDFDAADGSPAANVLLADSAVTAVTFVGTPQSAGTTASWAVGFTPSAVGALAAGDTITATFDPAFASLPGSIPSTPAIALGAGFANCSATASTSGSAVLITLADASGTCAAATGSAKSLAIAGIGNPAANTYVKANFSVATNKDASAAHPATDVVITTGTVTGVTFAGAPQSAGVTSTWTVGFTPTTVGALASPNTISVAFPAGFVLPASPATVALTGGFTGTCPTTGTVTGQSVLIDLTGTSCVLAAGTPATLTIAGIVNPVAGSKPAAGFTVATSVDGALASPAAPVVISAGVVTSVTFTAPLLTAGSVVPWTVGFTPTAVGNLSNAGGSNTVAVVFPNAFTMPSSPATVALTGAGTAGFTGTCPTTAPVSGHTVTVTLTSTCALAASTPAQLVISGIGNPVAGNQVAAGFTVATAKDTAPASPAADILITGATAPTNVSFSGVPQTAGAVGSTWTVGFQPSSASDTLTAGGKIVVKFDPGFAVTSPTVTTGGALTGCTATGAVTTGPTVTVTLAGGSCAQATGSDSTLTITGVTNPAANSYAAAGFSVATSLDTATASPASPIVISAGSVTTVTFAGTPQVTGFLASWAVGFRTSGAGALAASDTITATFDPAFVGIPATPTITLGAGFTSCTATGATSGTVVTVTLAGGSCAVAANTLASFTIAGITNPAAASYPAAGFSVATTKDTVPASPAAPIAISSPGTCTWLGATSTTWATATNWSGCTGGGAPTSSDNVIVPSTATSNRFPALTTGTVSILSLTVNSTTSGTAPSVTLSGGTMTVAGDVTINSGTVAAQFLESNNGTVLNIGGNFVNNGTFTASTSTPSVVFNGGANQSLTGSGATTFRGLTINPSNTSVVVTLSTPFTMSSGNASLTVSAGTLDLGTSALTISSSPPLTVSSGATLRYAGATFPSSGSFGTTNFNGTVEYNGTTVTQTVLNHSYTNLILNGSTTKTLPSASLSVTGSFTMAGTATTTAGGALTVGGPFTLGSGTTFNAASFTHSVAGNFANNGATFNGGTSTFNFTGNATQVIGGSSPTTFNNLNVSNNTGAGPSLSNTITVSGSTLNLGAKIITTGANTLALTNASPTVTRSTGFVNGNLQKAVAGTGSPSVTFEVGTTSPTVYAPVTVNFASTSTPGTLTVSSTAGLQPQFASSGLSQTQYVNRYWTAVNNGITFTAYDATLNFVAGDLVGSPDTSSLLVRKYDGAWSAPASSASTATSATGTGFTSFSDFAVGVTSVTYPFASSPDTTFGTNVPANALDGNLSTWWQPVAATATPTWVVDRGPGATSFSSVRTQWFAGVPGYQGVDYTIQTSPDGSAWSTAATVTGNTQTDHTDVVSSTSARYLRIVVTGFAPDGGDPFAHLALLEFSWSNAVSYPLATSPNTTFAGNVPGNAVDGNLSTWWQPVGATATPTLVVNRGPGAGAFSSVRSQWYGPGYLATNYTIETSTDGNSWSTAATVTGNTQADRTDIVPSTSDQYYRIVVTGFTSSGGDPFAHLALLEISSSNAVSYPFASSPDTSYLGNVPANAVDGNLSTWWQPVGATATPTLVVNRGPGAAAFTGVRSQWYGVGYQAINYTIQTSTDGNSWSTAATVTGNTQADRTDIVPSTSDQYVRIVVSSYTSSGDPFAHLALLEISTTNAVAYPIATSPDTTYLTNVPANAVDGNTSTYWQPVSGTVSPTLVVNRGPGAVAFSSVRSQWYASGYQAIDYTIQTSPDGNSWATAATVTGNAQADRTDIFGSTSDQYFRIVVTGFAPDGGDPFAHLALLEISTSNATTSPNTSYLNNIPPNATDGNVATYWQPVGGTSTPTLVVDRGPGAGPLSSVRTQWFAVGYQAVDYTIETSTDGNSWSTAATITGNTSADRTDVIPSTSNQYLRIVVTGQNPDGGDPFAHVALLELSWTNAVTYPLATSPNTSFLGNIPANAVDGNLSTWWQPVGGTATPTIVLNRGPGAAAFSSVHLQWYAVGYQAVDYTIETSTDGNSWSTAATVTGNALADRIDTIASTSAQYVRIVVTGQNPDGGDPYAHLALLEMTLS